LLLSLTKYHATETRS